MKNDSLGTYASHVIAVASTYDKNEILKIHCRIDVEEEAGAITDSHKACPKKSGSACGQATHGFPVVWRPSNVDVPGAHMIPSHP
mmetsp:Transcript_28775/g.60173  ORF Transcript_28775/g.60173 Transcript_28775/m.60173 type:complete len:85 (-) Transcript_28775:5602-5856(-)